MVRRLSERLVAAQRTIRILDAIKWDEHIEHAFVARGGRELPPVTRDYYVSRPLRFDPEQKLAEFHQLERDIQQQLGAASASGQMLSRICQEYRDVVHLLTHRGTKTFAQLSARLYGSASDGLHTGDTNLSAFLNPHTADARNGGDEATIDAGRAVAVLSTRLADYFQNQVAVRVKLSDRIVADAAAGGGCIKVRRQARFTPRAVRMLEVHEGWVHLGTTLNGQSQPVCTFLSKARPSATITQEGLAVVTEILVHASHPERVRRLSNRLEAVARAEAGANFLDVYRFFCDEGCAPRESYQHTMRVFRGSLPEGCGPFTKDLSYSKGFRVVCNFIHQAVRQQMPGLVPLLFCGKTNVADVQVLAQLVDEGLVAPPRFVPPQFENLAALAARLRRQPTLPAESFA